MKALRYALLVIGATAIIFGLVGTINLIFGQHNYYWVFLLYLGIIPLLIGLYLFKKYDD